MYVIADTMLRRGQYERGYWLAIVKGMCVSQRIGSELGARQTLSRQVFHDRMRLLQQLMGGIRILSGDPLE